VFFPRRHLDIQTALKWKNEADRIMSQYKAECNFLCTLRLLSGVHFGKKHYVVKELQPVQDKLDFSLCKGQVDKIEVIILSMADIAA
jgi:hypothetical protein